MGMWIWIWLGLGYLIWYSFVPTAILAVVAVRFWARPRREELFIAVGVLVIMNAAIQAVFLLGTLGSEGYATIIGYAAKIFVPAAVWMLPYVHRFPWMGEIIRIEDPLVH